MCSLPHRHSVFCVLPPHVLSSIATRGTARQREAALRTLAHDQTFRAFRTTVSGELAEPAQRTLASAPAKLRTIFDAAGAETLPGRVARTEGSGPTGDPVVDEAYDGLGHTWDFYNELFGRDSIDDHGLRLDATVHYGERYDNAFWNGEQMVFGDGDGKLFNRFTIALDVIGHELTHGVTENEAGLRYLYEPGAINESVSDVFGSLIKQKALGQTAEQADWLIGAGLLAEGVKGVALRSMKAPGTAYDDKVLGKDPQPATMKGFVRTNRDNGGVHINSDIPNHAFYLAAVAIGGNAWEKAGRVWYAALRDPRLRPSSGFKRFAALTTDQAGRLFGAGGAEQKAVRAAWKEVGVTTGA